ncbi:MAG: hypothetical protein ACRDLS_11955 [Solirubrobacteraceae bacterium]
MSETLRISVADLRRAAEVLLDHLQEVEGDVVELSDRMFWVVPAEVRYDVYEQPAELTIGQLSESLARLASVVESDEDALSYGLVWLADIARAIGEQTVR